MHTGRVNKEIKAYVTLRQGYVEVIKWNMFLSDASIFPQKNKCYVSLFSDLVIIFQIGPYKTI